MDLPETPPPAPPDNIVPFPPRADPMRLLGNDEIAGLDAAEIVQLAAERREDGLRALFFLLDQMPPGTEVEASGLAALLALAIGD